MLSEVSHGRKNHLTLEITGDAENIWWKGESSDTFMTAGRTSGVQQWQNPFGSGFTGTFRDLVKDVYQAIEHKQITDGDYPTFEDGHRLVKLCNTIAESHKQHGKWVNL